MKLLKQALGGLGALTVLAVIVAFIAPKTAHALAAALVQIVPGTTTHVGQNESQLVSLYCPYGELYCVSQDPSGTVSSTAFVVPAGYTLIVTDWEWLDSNGNTGGSMDYLVNGARVLASSLVLTDGVGDASTQEHYVTGFRVGSGATIYDFLVSRRNGEASIQGYLVPND